MVTQTVGKAFTKVFGSRNDRLLKKYRQRVQRINEFEPEIRKLSDPELRDKTQAFRDRLGKGEAVASIIPEALAVAREAMDRAVGIRNILNPEHGFDPTPLPAPAREIYDRVKARGRRPRADRGDGRRAGGGVAAGRRARRAVRRGA